MLKTEGYEKTDSCAWIAVHSSHGSCMHAAHSFYKLLLYINIHRYGSAACVPASSPLTL